MTISRRDFLKASALAASMVLTSTGLQAYETESASVAFNHGVASGDPLIDRVIIWTRVTPLHSDVLDVDVSFEVAEDKAFRRIVNSGVYTTQESFDYTVKVDVLGLQAGKEYFYRFSVGGLDSVTGRMKTLPAENPEQVKMAVFSCANYPNGYFNAYHAASKIKDLDVTVHLGDYIYEHGMYKNDDLEAMEPAYGTSNSVEIGRGLPEGNDTELIVLSDYRKRYALYRSDRDLQKLHKHSPMIMVWDDHEIANDSHANGAENHNEGEGTYEQRTEAALQAYFEWLPIRPVENKKEIFRSFDFGNLLSLHMLEGRVFGREESLSYANYYDANGNFDVASFTADLTDPNRTMLGSSQTAWLQSSLASSTATWQVLGQQVLMSRMHLPAEILAPIAQLDNPEAYGTTTQEVVTVINTLLIELVTIKSRLLANDPTLTEADISRVTTVLPYNLDAWDGYLVEREVILATAKALDKKLLVLAGDTHNAWASNLKDIEGNQVGVEFATASVSSPGLEGYLHLNSLDQSIQLEGALEVLIDDLKYVNTFERGFMEVTFTQEKVSSQWHYITNCDSRRYHLNKQREQSISILHEDTPLEIS